MRWSAKQKNRFCNGYFVAYTSSVICSFLANASCVLRNARSAALTVHRTVIHYRRLRFAYLKGKPWCAIYVKYKGFGGSKYWGL